MTKAKLLRTGDDLKDAKEELGQNKQPLVAIELSDEGAKKFAGLDILKISAVALRLH